MKESRNCFLILFLYLQNQFIAFDAISGENNYFLIQKMKYALQFKDKKEWNKTQILKYFYAMCFNLETSIHEPGHLKDVNQVQDIRVVMLHALKRK